MDASYLDSYLDSDDSSSSDDEYGRLSRLNHSGAGKPSRGRARASLHLLHDARRWLTAEQALAKEKHRQLELELCEAAAA